MGKKKNFIKCQDLYESFKEQGDTLLIFVGIGDDGATAFTGEPWKIVAGLERIISSGLHADAGREDIGLAAAMFAAIGNVLSRGDEVSRRFKYMLSEYLGSASDFQDSCDALIQVLRSIGDLDEVVPIDIKSMGQNKKRKKKNTGK